MFPGIPFTGKLFGVMKLQSFCNSSVILAVSCSRNEALPRKNWEAVVFSRNDLFLAGKKKLKKKKWKEKRGREKRREEKNVNKREREKQNIPAKKEREK